MIIDHQFELPDAPSSLWLYGIDDAPQFPSQVIIVEAALRMGVQISDDWETVDLGPDHNLAFRCTELGAAG